jgi:hypothetical protein
VGTTPKKLMIVAFSPVAQWPEIEAYEKQGHSVIRISDFQDAGTEQDWKAQVDSLCQLIATADVILGPTCWRMDEAHRKYLPLAIESARHARYPLKAKG